MLTLNNCLIATKSYTPKIVLKHPRLHFNSTRNNWYIHPLMIQYNNHPELLTFYHSRDDDECVMISFLDNDNDDENNTRWSLKHSTQRNIDKNNV